VFDDFVFDVFDVFHVFDRFDVCVKRSQKLSQFPQS